jgi:hypothetical protein
LLEYFSAGTGMSYDEAKNCAETEVRPVELIMEEELEYAVLEETANDEWNRHTTETYNFELSMMWEKLTGRRRGVLKQVYFCMLNKEDETPMDILSGVNVENQQLLKKQATKQVKSSAQKISNTMVANPKYIEYLRSIVTRIAIKNICVFHAR